jgi:hypothetical protein
MRTRNSVSMLQVVIGECCGVPVQLNGCSISPLGPECVPQVSSIRNNE